MDVNSARTHQTHRDICTTRIISELLNSFPEVVQVRFCLEVQLLECLEEIEHKDGRRHMGHRREPASTEELSPLGGVMTHHICALAETHLNIVYARSMTHDNVASLWGRSRTQFTRKVAKLKLEANVA